MTEVPKPRKAGKRRDEEVKYLGIMSWTPDKAKEVTELFLKWEIPKDFKILYGPCNVLGGNKSVTICEATDIALAKVDRYFTCCHFGNKSPNGFSRDRQNKVMPSN